MHCLASHHPLTVIPRAPSSPVIQEIIRLGLTDSRKLKRFLKRFEHNEHSIEDIIQDALIEAIRCEHAFQGLSSIETWFFGIAANMARRHVARLSVYCRRTTSIDESEDPSEWDIHLSSQMSTQTPDSACQFNRMVSSATAHIEKFPDELKRTFELVCIEGQAYQEVATEMNIPIGTVRSRVNRARKLLQQHLQ